MHFRADLAIFELRQFVNIDRYVFFAEVDIASEKKIYLTHKV